MASGFTKKIIVIKDIPSNFVEEAILILKSDVPVTVASDPTSSMGMGDSSAKRHRDYLIKEANTIINSYINECKKQGIVETKIIDKKSMLKSRYFTNTAINLALAGSIALLIFVITRII